MRVFSNEFNHCGCNDCYIELVKGEKEICEGIKFIEEGLEDIRHCHECEGIEDICKGIREVKEGLCDIQGCAPCCIIKEGEKGLRLTVKGLRDVSHCRKDCGIMEICEGLKELKECDEDLIRFIDHNHKHHH